MRLSSLRFPFPTTTPPLIRLYPRHHLLLRNQMINPLQQSQQALHIPAPLIQHVVRAPRLREAHHLRGAVDLRIHRLVRHQLRQVLLRLVGLEIEQRRQTRHLDARVVARHDAHVVLDDALAQVEPARVRLRVAAPLPRRIGLARGEDVRVAEVGPVLLGHHGPAHQLGHGEELEEGVVGGDEVRGAAVFGDAVEEVGLFVVVGGEDDEVDDALEGLG